MSGRDETEVTIDFKTGDKERPKDSKGPAPVKYANVKFLKSFFSLGLNLGFLQQIYLTQDF